MEFKDNIQNSAIPLYHTYYFAGITEPALTSRIFYLLKLNTVNLIRILVNKVPVVLSMFALLLMPVYASAQTPERITILESFGDYDSGEPIFVYGQIANLVDDSFLIMQIFNPQGDLCQIQQLIPLPNGDFITDVIPLKGRICGIAGEYEIKLFYGDYAQSSSFNVSYDPYSQISDSLMLSLAQDLLSSHSLVVGQLFDIPPPISNSNSSSLETLESEYVGLWSKFFVEDLIVEINPLIRPAVSSSLHSVQELLNNDEISFETAKLIDETVYAAIFYYEIGDKTRAIDLLTDAFVDVKNVNPEKITKRAPTFDELEATLLNLMKKSGTVMSKPVKNEIGFIFARGTAPIYTDELGQLVDVLSQSRYLDIISKKQSALYRLVQSDWDTLKPSLLEKESLADLLASSPRIAELHKAVVLLRELDDVDRFISSESDENSDLANILQPDWSDLERDLATANSIDDILESESQITQMAQVIDISSRISKSVEISQINGVNSVLISNWGSLLDRVDDAQSIDDILEIVSEFDQSMTQLREKRSPLSVLEFEYRSMKEKAELQADHSNLFMINNALKIIKTAKDIESGNPSITRIDRIEVLLSWASDVAPTIKSELDSYNKDAYKVRASDILQRAKSLENLVELSLTKNRFLPNYIEFTDTFNEKIDNVRDLVIQNDLDIADKLVRDLFDEWSLVSEAYANDPLGSDVGYTKDELKRIDFRKKLDTFSNMVSTFYNSDFAEHVNEYDQMMAEANKLVDLANFVDAEAKISEIGKYLSDYLVLHDENIIYEISFDAQKDVWVIKGATEKSVFDRRENLYVTVYNMDGSTHSSLEFTDTKQGNFFTQWVAPTDPGLYVVMLQYKDSQASQIVHVEEEFDYQYDAADLNMVELTRQFSELESFAQRFGGAAFQNPRFALLIDEIEVAIRDKNTDETRDGLNDLKGLIERYLPTRSRVAVIEATYENNALTVSGAVQKELAFRRRPLR